MEKVMKNYVRVDRADIISMFSLETYEKFHAWMKEEGFGHPQPQGGGDFHFDLDMYYEEPFEDEDPEECIYEEDYCPEVVEKMIKVLKAKQKESFGKDLPLIYVVESWQ